MIQFLNSFSFISHRSFCFLILALLLNLESAFGQPALQISRIENNFPVIKVYVRALCNKQMKLDLTQKDIVLKENKIPIQAFSISCPNVPVPCCISASLIFDRSGSMAGKRLDHAKQAGKAFIDALDGFCDEASITSFDTRVTLDLKMTSNKTLLKQAIDNFQAGGGTAVWDGTYSGIEELINNGGGSCRTVILLTDGEDNASSHTLNDVIALAKGHGIKVMTIGLIVDPAYEADLMRLAKETGGKYYPALTSEELKSIFLDIHKGLSSPLPECELSYLTSCADGMMRTVDVTLDYCGGKITSSGQYKAPLDTARSFESIIVKVGEGTTGAQQEVFVPLTLESLANENLQPSVVTINFDDQCMKLTDIVTDGTLFQNVPMSWKKITNGIELEIKQGLKLNVLGDLLLLKFRAGDPDLDITCPITISGWNFISNGGCVRVATQDGLLRIISRKPYVDCRFEMPAELRWQSQIKDYDQNPFSVSIILHNYGNREALNPKSTMVFNTKDLELYNPTTPTQFAQPKIIAREVGEAFASWEVRTHWLSRPDTFTICITTTFDNHPPIQCCQKIIVPPAGAILFCSAAAPLIQADKTTNSYSPMPFDVKVEIENRGGLPTDTVFALIKAPPEFSFIPSDRTQLTKRTSPALLLPGGKTNVKWSLTHPEIVESKTYYIAVCTYARNTDTTCCYAQVDIPGLSVPLLNCSLTVPDSIVYDDLQDVYSPNPFYVTTSVVNNGVLDADSVSATLVLPPELELFPQDQSLKKYFSPRTVVQWTNSLTPNELFWSVRAINQSQVKCVNVAINISGYDPIGKRYHETSCNKMICIPPHFITPMVCFISAPDSLQKDVTETSYIPNPFTVWCTVVNTGKRRIDSIKAELGFQTGSGLVLSQNESQIKFASEYLDPGGTASVAWSVKSFEKAIARNSQLNVRVFAKNPTVGDSYCTWNTFMPSLKVPLSCSAVSPDTLFFNKASGLYYPNPFQAALELANNSGITVRGIECTIVLPPELELMINEQSTKSIIQIAAGQSGKMFWNIRIAQNILTPKDVTIRFKYRQQGSDEYECSTTPHIAAAMQPKLECKIIAPDSILLRNSQYIPEQFSLVVKIFNRGNDISRDVQAHLIGTQRFNVLSQASQNATPLLKAGDSTIISFQLRVRAANQGAPDTIKVLITGDESSPTICDKIIWVEGEAIPQFSILCSTPVDSMLYNPITSDYTPNPFQVTINLTNTSSSTARECKLLYLGSKGFALENSQSIYDLGDIIPNQNVQRSFSVRTLRHLFSTVDTLIIQFQMSEENSGNIYIKECKLPLFVSVAKDKRYIMQCSAPSEIVKKDSTYLPSLFPFECIIINKGNKDGNNLQARIKLPAGINLAPNETALKNIQTLLPGNSIQIFWQLETGQQIIGAQVQIEVEVQDGDGEFETCYSQIVVTNNNASPFQIICSAPDSILIDKTTTQYINNPFVAEVQIFNSSSNTQDSVLVQAFPFGTDISIVDSTGPIKFVTQHLSPGTTTKIKWLLLAAPTTHTKSARIRFSVFGKDAAPVDCILSIILPGTYADNLGVTCSSIPEDTLRFKGYGNNYEYESLTYEVDVHNVSDISAREVYTTIVLPSGISLSDSEQSVKKLSPFYLMPGEKGSSSWTLKVAPQQKSINKQIRVQVSASNTSNRECSSAIFIQGLNLDADLLIPKNIFGKVNEEVEVPVVIQRAFGKGIKSYHIKVGFDPMVLAFHEVRTSQTLTASGWAGIQFQMPLDNEIEISDFTTGQSILPNEGQLLKIIFKGVFSSATTEPAVGISQIRFINVALNSGDVIASTNDGEVYITGTCIIPLNASNKYQLKQNVPNPFPAASSGNPITNISFSIPDESYMRLTIFNHLGIKIATLIDETVSRGDHTISFNAASLKSGLYFCKLETPFGIKIIKMIYQK